MATWFDLPAEVKEIIYGMITDVESIIYLPRDRRYKVDHVYESAHHFHDLLLVAKHFITPAELAFAILRHATVAFYSSNQLRRLVTEVDPSFKECIRQIQLKRLLLGCGELLAADDSFETFVKVPDILSTMPNLRRITVSCADYCAPLGHFLPRSLQVPTSEQHSAMLDYALRYAEGAEQTVQPAFFQLDNKVDVLANVIASFVGNRKTGTQASFPRKSPGSFAWTKPYGWIRRLVQHAENHDIEVVFRVNLSITSSLPWYDILYLSSVPEGPQGERCQSLVNEQLVYHPCAQRPCVELHSSAQMSTTDYMLRVKDDHGVEHSFYQDAAYQILHAKPQTPVAWWRKTLDHLRYDGPVMRTRHRFAF